MKKLILLLQFSLTLTLLLTCDTLLGRIINVPADYITIQEAIDSATTGDTVLVDTGTYYENINFRGKSIVVASKFILDMDPDFILQTIINGSKSADTDHGSCVEFLNKEKNTAVIQGFTLTGGTGSMIVTEEQHWIIEGGGIILFNASATIKNNIIINNSAPAGGGGIASFYDGKPNIYNNIIAYNTSNYAGGVVFNWCGGEIRNNIILGNNARHKYGSGGVMVWENSSNKAYIVNNTIVGNTAQYIVGGLSTRQGKTYVQNNIIWGNSQNKGEEISLSEDTEFTYNNTSEIIDGTGNISYDPDFTGNLCMLKENSLCIDAGDTASAYNDNEDPASSGNALFPSHNSIRNDLGAYGGKKAIVFPDFSHEELYIESSLIFNTEDQDSDTCNIIIRNLSTKVMRIDSIVVPKQITGFQAHEKTKNYELRQGILDTIPIILEHYNNIEVDDSLLIYHNGSELPNPQKIALTVNLTGIIKQDYAFNQVHSIKVFPNPVKDIMYVSIAAEQSAPALIQVRNLYGKTLLSKQYVHADLNQPVSLKITNLPAGVYFVTVHAGQKQQTTKFFRQ